MGTNSVEIEAQIVMLVGSMHYVLILFICVNLIEVNDDMNKTILFIFISFCLALDTQLLPLYLQFK